MALIIKGGMPPSCRWHNKQGKSTPVEVCPYFQNCPAEFNFEDYRPSDCPIIGEMPDEHGRLVDADILLADHPKTANWDYMVLECIIRNAPTVVEASK